MRFKEKSKPNDKSLLSLVIVDNNIVEGKIKRFIVSDSSRNWFVINSSLCVTISNKESGVDEDFKPRIVIKFKELSKYASSSKEIFIATVPDSRGNYNAYRICNYIKHNLKLSVPVYRMYLPSIRDEYVTSSLLNYRNVYLSPGRIYKYESRMVIDHLISYNVNQALSKYFPFDIGIESHSALILNFINSIEPKVYDVELNGMYSYLQLFKDETMLSKKIRSKVIYKNHMGSIPSLRDFYISSSGFIRWVGLVKSFYEAYANGCLTWASNEVSHRVPKQVSGDISYKKSGKNFGFLSFNNECTLSDNTSDIVSQISYINNSDLNYYRVAFSQNGVRYRLVHHVLNDKDDYFDNVIVKNNGKQLSLGASQRDLLSYLLSIGFPVSMIPWNIYILLKSGLIAYTGDTTMQLTSLGKYVLQILKLNFPSLLNERFIKKFNIGVANQIKSKDDMEYYDFVNKIWDKINDDVENIDDLKLPTFISRCPRCNKLLRLSITEKGVFSSCSNNKCSRSGYSIPLKFKGNLIKILGE